MTRMNPLQLVARNASELIGEERLPGLLSQRKTPIAYCGYEVSGKIHLGHLVTMTKLHDLLQAGFHVKVLFADWHTWLNQKGDWDFIREETKRWRKGFTAAGLGKAEFVLGSSFQRKSAYMDDVMKLIIKTTIRRALRSMQQVARDIEHAKVSQVFYPFMQIVDMKHLKVDLAHSGIEQRKIHMLAVELLPGISYKVPVFVHTPLIASLRGQGKMSSSEPASLISIDDTEEEIKEKVQGAHCEAGNPFGPLFDILKLVIFPRLRTLHVGRPARYGGHLEISTFEETAALFAAKKLHPQDLKTATSQALIDILAPIRQHFRK